MKRKGLLILLLLVVSLLVVTPAFAAPGQQEEIPDGEVEVDVEAGDEADSPLINIEGSLSSIWQLVGFAAAGVALIVSNRWVFEKLISSPIVDSIDNELLKKLQPLLVTVMAILVAQVFDLDLAVVLSDVLGFVNAPANAATGELLTGVGSGLGAIALHERLASTS